MQIRNIVTFIFQILSLSSYLFPSVILSVCLSTTFVSLHSSLSLSLSQWICISVYCFLVITFISLPLFVYLSTALYLFSCLCPMSPSLPVCLSLICCQSACPVINHFINPSVYHSFCQMLMAAQKNGETILKIFQMRFCLPLLPFHQLCMCLPVSVVWHYLQNISLSCILTSLAKE